MTTPRPRQPGGLKGDLMAKRWPATSCRMGRDSSDGSFGRLLGVTERKERSRKLPLAAQWCLTSSGSVSLAIVAFDPCSTNRTDPFFAVSLSTTFRPKRGSSHTLALSGASKHARTVLDAIAHLPPFLPFLGNSRSLASSHLFSIPFYGPIPLPPAPLRPVLRAAVGFVCWG